MKKNKDASITNAKLSPEFSLLLACLQSSNRSENARKRLIQPEEPISWQQFYQLSQIHKVTPLVWEILKNTQDLDIPENISQDFRSTVYANTRKAMIHTIEVVKIIRTLNQQNIQVVPLKGSVLALKAYGNLARRHAGDIDLLLILPENLWQADQLIQEMGCHRKNLDFGLSPRQKLVFIDSEKDIVYKHSKLGIILELHFNWSRNSGLLPMDLTNMWENCESVKMANTDIICLNDDDHLHYLFVHGAAHAWYRLKWLCDIPVMIHHLTETKMENFWEQSKKLGTSRMVQQGLELSTRFLAMSSPRLLSQYSRKTANRCYLNEYATKAIINPDKNIITNLPLTQKLFHMLKELRYAMLLRSDMSYKRKQLSIYLTVFPDWNVIRLPDQFFCFYYILRPFIWIMRQLKRR
jgi:hypothetical protein